MDVKTKPGFGDVEQATSTPTSTSPTAPRRRPTRRPPSTRSRRIGSTSAPARETRARPARLRRPHQRRGPQHPDEARHAGDEGGHERPQRDDPQSKAAAKTDGARQDAVAAEAGPAGERQVEPPRTTTARSRSPSTKATRGCGRTTTDIKADKIILEDKTGNLRANGNVSTSMVLTQAATRAATAQKPARREPTITTADELLYEDARHRATYTGRPT